MLFALLMGFMAGSALVLILPKLNPSAPYLRAYGVAFLALTIWLISAEWVAVVSQAGWLLPSLTFLVGIGLALLHSWLLWRSVHRYFTGNEAK